jgi:elongation factor G
MEKYLEGAELSEDEIIAGIRRATLAAKAVPVLTGSAFENKGVQPMLDAVVRYLPSPLDVDAIVGHNVADSSIEVTRQPNNDEPMSALAFKVIGRSGALGDAGIYPAFIQALCRPAMLY